MSSLATPSPSPAPGPLSRRTFAQRVLASIPVALAGPAMIGAARSAFALADDPATPPQPNPISLAQWSFHRALYDGRLDPLDFPKAARRLGIPAVEYVNSFYVELLSRPDWARELRRRCEGEGVRSVLIMCDGEGDLGDPDAGRRATAVANHEKWLDAAAILGCHAIRVNARSSGSPAAQTEFLDDGLGALADKARSRSLSVIVENHGGQSSDGVWLAATIKAASRPNLGTLPDFGNFRMNDREWRDRYAGVEAMMPLARAVSAKSYDFDQAGAETTIDYPRMLGIVHRAGYTGHVGIEYEGRRLSEEEGILATKRLLERCGCRAQV